MNHAIAKTFITVHIAGILSRTMEWKGDPDQRADADWQEAERIVNENPFIIEAWIAGSELSYQKFEEEYGNKVWSFTQPRRNNLKDSRYGRILFD